MRSQSWKLAASCELPCSNMDLTENAVVRMLYDDGDSVIGNFKQILSDIDVAMPQFSLYHDPRYGHAYRNTLLDNSAHILDKLCVHNQLGELLSIMSQYTYPYAIINHTLKEFEVIRAYTYRHSLIHRGAASVYTQDEITAATKNGFIVRKLYIRRQETPLYLHGQNYVQYVRRCTNIELKRFTYLRELHVYDNAHVRIISNDRLEQTIEVLNVSGNDTITTCAPFAKSLRALYANRACISDNGLSLCTLIELLFANNNSEITTCAPFAKSLRTLFADGRCGISDEGLHLCTSIVILSANNNSAITTCHPFANTLQILSAQSISFDINMCNKSLERCFNIRELYISDNKNITTCKTFVRTLTRLSAYNCDAFAYGELNRCKQLRKIYTNIVQTNVPPCATHINKRVTIYDVHRQYYDHR